MQKTHPPLGVVAFEDRVAPAVYVRALDGLGLGQAVQVAIETQSLSDFKRFPGATAVMKAFTDSDGGIVTVRSDRIGDDQLVSVSRVQLPIKHVSKAAEATPSADPGRVQRDSSDRGPVRDASPGTTPRGSSNGPVPTATPAVVSALVGSEESRPPESEAAAPAPAADRPAETTAGLGQTPITAVPTGPVVWRASDYVFLEPESVEPPQAEPMPMPEEPLPPDEPQIVPALVVDPVPAAESAPSDPLAGLLPFNLGQFEGAAQDLLSRVAGIGTEIVDELEAGSEYAWLGIGALAAAGAVYASRPTRKSRLTGPGEYDSVFARWEGKDAAPPR
jgi:hypothetical protein